MKRVIWPSLALVIVLGLMMQPAKPAPAGKGDHYKGHFKGLGAEAYWFMCDDDTGVCTDCWISAVDELSQNPPGRPQKTQWVAITIYQYRYDADEYVPIRDVYYFGTIPAESLAVNRSLASASLTADGLEGWQWDYATETATAVIIDVQLDWSATGPKSSHHSNYHFRSPSGFYNSHSAGKSREAVALGQLAIDGISTLLDAPGSAYITSTKEGYVEVYRTL